MKTNPDDGAFGMSSEDGFQLGLTKREYFAAMAMQAFASRADSSGTYKAFAEDAVAQADALIKELNKQESEK
jgi:hypothetical protein